MVGHRYFACGIYKAFLASNFDVKFSFTPFDDVEFTIRFIFLIKKRNER